jgi:hypothetical protein
MYCMTHNLVITAFIVCAGITMLWVLCGPARVGTSDVTVITYINQSGVGTVRGSTLGVFTVDLQQLLKLLKQLSLKVA